MALALKMIRPGQQVEVPSCNLCGGAARRILYTSQDWRLEVDSIPYSVVRCLDCQHAYLCPRPTPESIARYYPPRYYDRRGPEHVPDRLAQQAQYLQHLQPGALLDVGCARGDFLMEMTRRGWRTCGLEPHQQAEPVSGAVVVRDWDDPRLARSTFRAITAWSVFEHMHDPLMTFRQCTERLAPDGELVIHVPNLRSVFSRFSYQEDVPRHLHFFTERSLARYADAAGLELVEVCHDNRIMDGSGRGFLRLRAYRLLGGSTLEWFRWGRVHGRRQRFSRHPVFFLLLAPLALVERLLCADVVRTKLRVNGYIVARFMRRPTVAR